MNILTKIKIFGLLLTAITANIAFGSTNFNTENVAIEQSSNNVKAPRTDKINHKLVTELRKIAIKNENNTTKDKIIAFSNYLIGKPYDKSLADKLITWDKKRDKRKLIELEQFDCLSYVETLLALSQVKNVPNNNKDFIKSLSESLSSIMFAVNDVSYTGRNHFFDTEWIKSNERLIAKNITDDLPYAKSKIAKIDKAEFLRNQLKNYAIKYVKEENREKFSNKFEKNLSKFSPIESQVKYISFSDFITNKNEIEKLISDKIFLFAVVIDKPELLESTKSEHNIAHIGFIYMKDGKLILNHSLMISEVAKNQEIDFVEYAQQMEQKLSFVGFSLYQLN